MGAPIHCWYSGCGVVKNILLILLVVCGVAALVLWLSPESRNEAKSLLRDTGLISSTAILYKWRNEQGVWQYTQTPPPEGIAYEKVEARSDINVLPLPETLKSD